MDNLRKLATKAATELRKGGKPGPHTKALGAYFNSMISDIVLKKEPTFDVDLWTHIVRAIEKDYSPEEDELFFWVAGLAGEISLLQLRKQNQVAPEHLLRNIISFCDAIDIVLSYCDEVGVANEP